MTDSFQPVIWLAAINQGRAPLSHGSPGAVFLSIFFQFSPGTLSFW